MSIPVFPKPGTCPGKQPPVPLWLPWSGRCLIPVKVCSLLSRGVRRALPSWSQDVLQPCFCVLCIPLLALLEGCTLQRCPVPAASLGGSFRSTHPPSPSPSHFLTCLLKGAGGQTDCLSSVWHQVGGVGWGCVPACAHPKGFSGPKQSLVMEYVSCVPPSYVYSLWDSPFLLLQSHLVN